VLANALVILLLDQRGHRNMRPVDIQEVQNDLLSVLKFQVLASVGTLDRLDPEYRVEPGCVGVAHHERDVEDPRLCRVGGRRRNRQHHGFHNVIAGDRIKKGLIRILDVLRFEAVWKRRIGDRPQVARAQRLTGRVAYRVGSTGSMIGLATG